LVVFFLIKKKIKIQTKNKKNTQKTYDDTLSGLFVQKTNLRARRKKQPMMIRSQVVLKKKQPMMIRSQVVLKSLNK